MYPRTKRNIFWYYAFPFEEKMSGYLISIPLALICLFNLFFSKSFELFIMLKSILDSPGLNFFFFTNLITRSKSTTSLISNRVLTPYVALFPVVSVSAFSKIPVKRSSALESIRQVSYLFIFWFFVNCAFL